MSLQSLHEPQSSPAKDRFVPLARLAQLRLVRRLAAEWSGLTRLSLDLISEDGTERHPLGFEQRADPLRCSCIINHAPAQALRGGRGDKAGFSDCRLPSLRHCITRIALPQGPAYLVSGAFLTGETDTEGLWPRLPEELARLFSHFVQVISEEISQFVSDIKTPAPSSAGADGATALVGNSQSIVELRALVREVAATDYPVLIEGESGTGKDVVASMVHASSARAHRPFVVLSCAALPESLFESEAFGHGRGAFTGAHVDKPGLFESADAGTLFLDEIDSLSIASQAKLLRVLECGTFYRLGSVRPRSVDVRVLAATNQDLQKLVAEGRFRADLYYRLKVGSLRLAPLRDRSADIPLLARHFLARIAQSRRQPAQVLAAEVARALQGYAWPGNVRQLLHELEAACVRARGTQLAVAHLSGEVRVSLAGPFHSRRGALLKEFERREIEAGLVRVGWNVTALAKQMGVGRRTLIAKIARLQIVRPPRQSPPAAPARAGSRFSPRQHMLPD